MIKQLCFACAICTFALLQMSCSSGNQTVKTQIEVSGHCNVCKHRIEQTLSATDGILSAQWDLDTQQLSVAYESGKIIEEDIHRILTSIGHDTKSHEASTAAYEDNCSCCNYRSY